MWKSNTSSSRTIHKILLILILGMSPFRVFPGPVPFSPQEGGLESVLRDLADYRRGEDDAVLLRLRALIMTMRQTEEGRAACERHLLRLLAGEATPEAKEEACRHLRTLGTADAIPVLEPMLLDASMSDMARYALEKIPDPGVDQALLNALQSTDGAIRLGLISSLGHRRSSRAVPALAGLANGFDTDPDAAGAAVTALGRIAVPEAARVLLQLLRANSPAQDKTAVAGSLLSCAEAASAGGSTELASQIYSTILASESGIRLRGAALRGLISAAASASVRRDQILDVLDDPDPAFHAEAIALVPQAFAAHELTPLLERLSRLPETSQVQLIAVLTSYDSDMTLVALIQALTSPAVEIREAALRALGVRGDASTVRLLVRHAVKSRGSEQEEARTALWNLRGEKVDQAVLEALARETDPLCRAELIRCVGERRIEGGKPVLFALMESAEPEIRIQAIRAVRDMCLPRDIPDLIERLLISPAANEQAELAAVTAAAAHKIGRPYARADLIVRRYQELEGSRSRSLLATVLGKIGDDSSLPVLRGALTDPDGVVREAAARALIEWPTTTARDDVLWIARKYENPTVRVLAVRAAIRMVEIDAFRRPQARVDAMRTILPLVERAEEKIALLGVLSQIACAESLELAESFLDDPAVQDEARTAVDRLRRALDRG
jgi:HEAT repeat protein